MCYFLILQWQVVRNYYMNGHMKIHTGERPYKCTECDQVNTVSRHLRIYKTYLYFIFALLGLIGFRPKDKFNETH